jgi:putative two-component system response regulator
MSSHARFLIVDDDPENVRLLRAILKSADYEHIESAPNGYAALEHLKNYSPDIILLDLMMGGMDGFEFLTRLRAQLPADSYLPVLVLTSDNAVASRERALALGATDFVLRPHETFDVILRVRNLLHARFLHLEVLARNDTLEAQVRERTSHLEESKAELKMAQLDVIDRLALVGEHHDDDTGAHTQRVARISRMLAQHIGMIAEEVEMIRRAAPLHDVGKIGVSDTILLKPGKLTDEEFAVIKRHCEIGAQLLSGGRSELLRTARSIAYSHHERFDGSGYPCGLSGEDIPLEGRIVAIADVFDALTHERPYKGAWPASEAALEIKRQSGRQFDPDIVDAFCQLPHEDLVNVKGAASRKINGSAAFNLPASNLQVPASAIVPA